MSVMRSIAVSFLISLMALLFGGLPAIAKTYGDLSAALANGDWGKAAPIASELDAAEGGGSQFFSLYVAVSETVSRGNCDTALPLLSLMKRAKPYFVPAYELSYFCNRSKGNRQAQIADLTAIIAILPPGPQQDLVRQMLASDQAADGIGVSFYGSITPSTNANRQTSATRLGVLTIAPSSRAQMGINGKAGISLTKNFFSANGVFVAGVLRAELNYSSVSQLISPRLFLEVPVSFSPLKDTKATLTPFVNFEFSRLSHTATHAGARLVVSHSFTDADNLTVQTSFARDDYPFASYLNGWSSDSVVALSHTFNPNLRLTGKASLLADFTDNAANSRIEISGGLRLDYLMDNGLLVGAEGILGRRFHNKPPPLSLGPNQTDTFVRGTLELSHKDIVIGPFMPTLTYAYQRQFSDNVFYDFQSHDVGISLRAKL